MCKYVSLQFVSRKFNIGYICPFISLNVKHFTQIISYLKNFINFSPGFIRIYLNLSDDLPFPVNFSRKKFLFYFVTKKNFINFCCTISSLIIYIFLSILFESAFAKSSLIGRGLHNVFTFVVFLVKRANRESEKVNNQKLF